MNRHRDRLYLAPWSAQDIVAQTYTPTTTNQIIKAGTVLLGDQTVSGSAQLVAGNIKSGVSLFSITGTYTGLVYGTGGALQTIIPNFTDRVPTSIAGSEDGRYIYIISRNGSTYYIDVSSDGGRTFTNKYASTINWGVNTQNEGVCCSTTGQYVLVYGANNSGTVYKSSDYGANFTSVALGSATQSWFATMNEAGSIMYVNAFESSVGKLFRSANNGVSFTATATNPGQLNSVDCDSTGAIIFVAIQGSQQVKKSTDSGATFPTSLGYIANNYALKCNSAGDTYVAGYGASGAYYKNVSGVTTNIGFNNNSSPRLTASRDLSVIIGNDTTAYLTSYYRCGSFDLSGTVLQQLFPLNVNGWVIQGSPCKSNTSIYFVASQATSNQIMLCRYLKQ